MSVGSSVSSRSRQGLPAEAAARTIEQVQLLAVEHGQVLLPAHRQAADGTETVGVAVLVHALNRRAALAATIASMTAAILLSCRVIALPPGGHFIPDDAVRSRKSRRPVQSTTTGTRCASAHISS